VTSNVRDVLPVPDEPHLKSVIRFLNTSMERGSRVGEALEPKPGLEPGTY
jgi:hypothetical protein